MNTIRKATELFLQLLKYPLFVLLALFCGQGIEQVAKAYFPMLPNMLLFLIECIVLFLLGYALLWVSSFWGRLPLLISLPLGGLSVLGITCESVAIYAKSIKWNIWLFPWVRLAATSIFTGAPNQRRKHFLPDERILMLLAAIGCLTFRHLGSKHYVQASLPWGAFLVYLVAAIQYHLAAEQRRKAHMEQPQRVLQKEITSDEDKIGFARVQEGILKRIREKLLAQTQTNDGVCHVLGLFGPWGSGKTHLLNLVEKELVGNAPSTIPSVAFRCINLWQISNRDELWQTTCTTLERAYCIPQSFFQHLSKRLKAMGHIPAVDSWSAVAHTIFRWQERDPVELMDEFQQRLKAAQSLPIVLLFDNVERAKLSIIRELLPLTERLKRLPNLFIILSIAEDELVRKCEAKGQHADTMYGHLFKLIDTPVYMPIPNEAKVQEFFRELCNTHTRETSFLRRYAKETPPSFDTPRQIYRGVTALLALEEKRFSESTQFIKEAGLIKAYPFIHVAYTTELIHLFYPLAFEALRNIPQRWLTYIPQHNKDTDPVPLDEEVSASMGEEISDTLPDLIKQPAIIQRAMSTPQPVSPTPPFLESVKTWQEHLNQRLFRSLMGMLKKQSATHLRQALELQTLDTNTFSDGQCEAVIHAASWLNGSSSMKDFVDRVYPASFRPSTESCLSTIAYHCTLNIRSAECMDDATPYICALLHLLSAEEVINYINWETLLATDAVEWSLLAYTCRQSPQVPAYNTAWKAMQTWIAKCSFTTLHYSINFLLRSQYGRYEDRVIYTPLAGKRLAFSPDNYNHETKYLEWKNALGKRYAYTILEQLNNNKQPSSLTSRDYMVFHANEFLDNTSFTLTMQAGVSAWIADHPMPMPTFLLNLLSMLSIPYDNGSDTPLPYVSDIFAGIYQPVFGYCAEYIHELCPSDEINDLLERAQQLLEKLGDQPLQTNTFHLLLQNTIIASLIKRKTEASDTTA